MALEDNGLGVCLICQADFGVEELQRLHRTICCGSLLHWRCFQEMNTRTSSCAACRFETEPENPRALELPIDDLDELPSFTMEGGMLNRFQNMVLEDAHHYCRVRLPFPHRPGSAFWSNVPFFYS